MKQTLRICQRALGTLFRSPLAYVVLTLFLLSSGFFFYHIVLERTISLGAMRGQGSAPAAVCREFWRITGWIMLFIVPIISMGSLAGEKSKGTMELLLTSPLTFSNLVWGKFCALLFFYLVLLAPTTIYFGFMRWHGHLGFGQIASGYVGAILLGGATLSIGIFISALTGNQIVAAFGTFGALLCFWFIDAAGSTMPSFWRSAIRHFSFYVHYKTIITGKIGVDDVVYFLSVAVFFLFMTHVSIRALWKTGKWD